MARVAAVSEGARLADISLNVPLIDLESAQDYLYLQIVLAPRVGSTPRSYGATARAGD